MRRNADIHAAISSLLQTALTDLPLERILEQSLDLILSLDWLSFQSKGCIFLADSKGNLFLTAQKNMPEQGRKICANVPSGKCLCGRAALEKEMVFADHVDEKHQIIHLNKADHGHYCVPVLNKQKLLGVLNIYLRPGHVRSEIEVQFLNAVADALAGIIDRKHAEEEKENLIRWLEQAFDAIARSKKEWEETFDSIEDPIYIADSSHTIIRANKAFAAYLEMDLREVINQKCYMLVHGRSTPSSECPHWQSLQEHKPYEGELADRRTGRVFQVSAFPFRLSQKDEVCSIVIMKDITDDRDKEMRLIMSERLASLGQMAAGIAHEINNPLAAIAGSAEGLLNRVQQNRYDPVLFTSYLRIIDEEIARCKKITTSMLSFVRPGSRDHKSVELHELLDSTLELIGFQGRLRNVDVLKHYYSGSCSVIGNAGELKQVLLSVITNALDAMTDQGTLTIRTGQDERGMFVHVTDTGTGIALENQHRIFDPFFTTKSERGGTGLGLSIAKKIIAGHNGDIRVSSESGKGATFIIILPSL